MAGQWDSCVVRIGRGGGGWCVRKGVEATRMKKGGGGGGGGALLRKGSDLATVPGAQRLQGSAGCPGFSTVTVLEGSVHTQMVIGGVVSSYLEEREELICEVKLYPGRHQ